MQNLENYYILLRPLVGAGIGYITNLIAVKMLFHPIKPIKIWKFTLPFTPGIIPKNQSRLAHSIANSISNKLLTEDTLKQSLLSEEMKNKLIQSLDNYLDELQETNKSKSLEDYLSSLISEEDFLKEKSSIKLHLTNNIYNKLLNYNIGNIIANELTLACEDSIKDSTIGKLFGKNLIKKVSEKSQSRINTYIEENGHELIYSMVDSEINKYCNSTKSDFLTILNKSNLNIKSIVLNLYESFILNNLNTILNYIDISSIIENKIANMDTKELENLILKIMKKELNALVNLGAVIGFLLGLINLFI